MDAGKAGEDGWTAEWRRRLGRYGFALVPSLLEPGEADALAAEIDRIRPINAGVSRRRGGIRGLMARSPAVRELAHSSRLLSIASAAIGAARPVRATMFEKSRSANWSVGWHQDVTIAVTERREAPGFGPWSVKEGVIHVQPPAAVLSGMLSVRLHLDDCGEDCGPLRVIPGSHAGGRLSREEIALVCGTGGYTVCSAARGDGLFLRPLLVHASSGCVAGVRRRVIHIDYAACPLPAGLEWAEAT